jgi:hypothetical protein
MWYIYTKEFYSAQMNEDYKSFAGKWMELEIVMLSDINQSHEDKYCMFSLICAIWGGSRRGTIMDVKGEKEMRNEKG